MARACSGRAGAAFLVGAAIKLLLLDFGSLGQLANILAVIAAGGVFLLVGWLAPMPPARGSDEKAEPDPPRPAGPVPASPGKSGAPAAQHAPQAADAMQIPDAYWQARRKSPAHAPKSSDRFAWTVAIVAITLITLSQCGTRLFRVQRPIPAGGDFAARSEPAPPEPDSIEAAAPPAVESAVAPAESGAGPASEAFNQCDEWRMRLPDTYEPHLVTALPAQSARAERLIYVDAPGRNVVLVLLAPFPAYWTIRTANESRVVGIWLPIDVPQEFRNVPQGARILHPGSDPDSCARTPNGSSSLPYAVAQRVLKRPFSSEQVADEGRWVVIGKSTRQEAAN